MGGCSDLATRKGNKKIRNHREGVRRSSNMKRKLIERWGGKDRSRRIGEKKKLTGSFGTKILRSGSTNESDREDELRWNPVGVIQSEKCETPRPKLERVAGRKVLKQQPKKAKKTR